MKRVVEVDFSYSPAIGEPVYAIGSPYGFGGSLSVGVVSGVERLIQLADLGFPYPQAAYAVAGDVRARKERSQST